MDNLPPLINPVVLDDNYFKFNSSQKKVFYFVATAVIVFSILYYLLCSAPVDFPENKVINIKEGSSLRYVSKYLKDNNIIRSRVMFETFVIIFGDEKYVALGDYLF